MSQIVPAANLVIDCPDADGLITAHGMAKVWQFQERPDDSNEWEWEHSDTQIIRALNAASPRSYVPWADMTPADWTFVEGTAYWKTARPVQKPRQLFLFYAEASATAHGRAVSNTLYWPSVFCRLLRFAPVDGATESPRVYLQFAGDGETYYYAVRLPWPTMDEPDHEHQVPSLWRNTPGGGEEDWREIARYEAGAELQSVDGIDAQWQDVQVEQIGEYLIIHLSRTADPWIVYTGQYGLRRGPVAVDIYGQAAMFNLQNLRFPASSYIQTRQYLVVPYWIANSEPAWTRLGEVPDGTGITAAAVVNPEDERQHKARFTFTSDTYRRPVLYAANEYITGTIGNARTSEANTQGDMRLLSATWSRNNDYRGATFEATLREPWEYAWAGNEKAQLQIAWDDGTGPMLAAKVTGYIVPEKPLRGGETRGERRVTVRATDAVNSRLWKKFMVYMPNFEGWELSTAFTYVLNRCGIPSTQIAINEAVDSDFTIPVNDPPWERKYLYSDDTCVVTALDELVGLWGGYLHWGVDAAGYFFLKPRPQWTTGDTPDFILDQDTTTDADVAIDFAPERSPEDFCNYVGVFTGSDNREPGMIYRNVASHRSVTDPFFVGDDLWDVQIAETHAQAVLRAQERSREVLRWRDAIEWTTRRVDLTVDQFVQVNCETDCDIPAGTVYRIVEERGQVDMDSFDATVTYLMVVEEYGS